MSLSTAFAICAKDKSAHRGQRDEAAAKESILNGVFPQRRPQRFILERAMTNAQVPAHIIQKPSVSSLEIPALGPRTIWVL